MDFGDTGTISIDLADLAAANMGAAVICVVVASFLGKNRLIFFVLGLLFGPLALAILIGSSILGKIFGGFLRREEGSDAVTRATPETRGSAPRSRREEEERERIRGLIQGARDRKSAATSAATGDSMMSVMGGLARSLGKEEELRKILERASQPQSGSTRPGPPRTAAKGSGGLPSRARREEPETRVEREARRSKEAAAETRARDESHRRRHSKMPASGLSPDDPEFLRGYRPKNNRIP